MTTARLHYPIRPMTPAPTVNRRARSAPKVADLSADAMNPFARRPRNGATLSVRERVALAAIYAAVATFICVVLFR